MALDFNRYAGEGNTFLKQLAEDLGHPEEIDRTAYILRSVMHVLRDRLTVSESMDIIAQLPMFLKAVYVENWKFREKPERIKSVDEFKEKVKELQASYGEQEFDRDIHTEEIVKVVLKHLGKYITNEELDHIKTQLPEELYPILKKAYESE